MFNTYSWIVEFAKLFVNMSRLKQKHIEQFLQDMTDFEYGEKDKMNLEQHMTPPNVAAQLLYYVYLHEPVDSMLVADLGVGTGMLSCGLVYIGSLYTIGVELDNKYVRVARDQLDEKVEGGLFDIVNANVAQLKLRKQVDLVVMNPPFGTKEEGIDCKFLQFAFEICTGNIYSMHKSSTRTYLTKFCAERGYQLEVLLQVNFPLKKRFSKFHKKDVAFTQVDVIKVTPIRKPKNQQKEKQQKTDFKKGEKNEKQSTIYKVDIKEQQKKEEQPKKEEQIKGKYSD